MGEARRDKALERLEQAALEVAASAWCKVNGLNPCGKCDVCRMKKALRQLGHDVGLRPAAAERFEQRKGRP